ncbi:MAG TPA: NUDIX hydrolase [Steroidobacteraceae bacterium]|nr:NUDIX hydrolase [Steroidobacteraceae bacterium]
MDPQWLEWVKQLQALAQTGLAFVNNEYDRERYTTVMAIAAAMAADRAGDDPARLAGIFAAEGGYATPKVDVRAAAFQGERILLVKERADGGWTLPGGWADIGDGPRSAVEREAREESGYEVRAMKLAAVYDRNRHEHTPHLYHIWKLFFVCEIIGGAPSASIETEAVEFFALDALPPLSIGRVTALQIAHMFEHRQHPGWPTTFD